MRPLRSICYARNAERQLARLRVVFSGVPVDRKVIWRQPKIAKMAQGPQGVWWELSRKTRQEIGRGDCVGL